MIDGPYKFPPPWYDYAEKKKRRVFWLKAGWCVFCLLFGFSLGMWLLP